MKDRLWRWGQGGTQGGMPARFGLVALGSALLWFGIGQASLPGGKHGRMFQVVPGLAMVMAAMLCLALAGARLVPSAEWRRRYRRGRWGIVAVAALLTLGTLGALDSGLYTVLQTPTTKAYINDVISFTHVNAQDALAGHNPYLDDDNFIPALRDYPKALATPLRRGAFGTAEDYPTRKRIETLEARYLAAPQAARGEFDPATLHSYPALSFLLYVPFIWAGMRDILLLHLLLYCALFAWLVWLAPVGQRGWAVLAAGAGLAGFYSLSMDSEVVCVAFLLAAWHWRERRWVSAVALGLGCAFKQYCWFFAPFLLLDALYAYGWREALKRAGIALGAFLLPNLPYLVASPGAWVRSLLLPMAAPMYPMGIGPISLSIGHLLPYLPSALYTALELAAFAAMLRAQWRWREQLGAGVLVLALVPLLFAFRSPSNYFAFAPWLALYAACVAYGRRETTEDAEERTERIAERIKDLRRKYAGVLVGVRG